MPQGVSSEGLRPGGLPPPTTIPNDPFYTQLMQYGVEGPFLKLYYDWGKSLREPGGADQYKPGDGLRRAKFVDALKQHLVDIRQPKQGNDE